MGDNDNAENLSQKVDDLLDEGLTPKEIEEKGFSPGLIRQRVRRRQREDKGPPGNSGRSEMALRRDKESVLPEWLEADVAEIFDGQTRDRKLFLAGMAVPLMGLRLFCESIKPLIDLLDTWQRGQAEAARTAQGAGQEVAQQAAIGVAQRIMPEIQSLKSQIGAKSAPAPAPDPVTRMMSMMQGLPQMLQVGQQLAHSMGLQLPGQAAPQAPAQGGAQQPQASPAWEPPPIETHSIDELEGNHGG
ncbi:MAG: hypothetical protein HY671_04985 [Chloroflexi bacterium]|nr:hypothetical protein [Chloroflexota bacterium]